MQKNLPILHVQSVQSYTHQHSHDVERYRHSPKFPTVLMQSIPFCHPQPLATTHLLSVLIVLLFQNESSDWLGSVCSLLGLTSFILKVMLLSIVYSSLLPSS